MLHLDDSISLSPYLVALIFFLLPFTIRLLGALGRKRFTEVTHLRLSAHNHLSQYLHQLWASALSMTQYKKPLWPRVKSALSYGHNHEYLEGSLTTQTFNKGKSVGSLYGLWYPQIWWCLQYQMCNPSCGIGLTTHQKAVGSSHTRHATVAPVSTTCLAGWYYSMQCPGLSKPTDIFAPLIHSV